MKILRLAFYLLFCITPFIFTKFNSELFEFNKMLFVYALTIITSGVWLLRMVSEKKIIFKRTPLDLPLVLFLLSQIISTVFSIDPHTSIWGYYSRLNGGLLSIISYILLYYAFVSNFIKEDVVKILKAALFAGGLVSFYAIPEHFGFSPSCLILTNDFSASCWVQDVQARVFGTIGQPNWLAAYLAMLIFPVIYFFLTSKTSRQKILYFLLSIIYYLAFTFTYSRGATLGLIAGFAVLIISQLLASHLKGVKLNLASFKPLGITIGSLLLINLLFGSALTEFRILKNPAVPVRPGISQQVSASGTQLENGGTESGQIRLIVWKGAIDIFKAYPFFGSGVETFAYAYYQFRPNSHNLVSEWDFLYNKAHNEYLNYLATTGAFGFLTYMAIIITFGGFCIRYYVSSLKNKSHNTDYLLLATLAAGYISYLIQNFFLFSVVMIALLFYLYPALAFVYLDRTKDLSEKGLAVKILSKILKLITRKNLFRKLAQVLIIIIILLLLNSLYNFWEADTQYKKGSDYNDAGNPGRAYNYLIEAVRLNPNEPLYLSELGNAAASSALALSATDATTSGQLKDDSIFFTDLGLAQSPANTTILRTAIRTYFQLALLDPKLESKTLETVDKSIKLAPTDPKLLLNKAVILTQFAQAGENNYEFTESIKKQDEAIESLQKAILLKPNYLEAKLQLAQLYLKSRNTEKAKEEIDYILKMIPNDPEAIKLLEELEKIKNQTLF